MKQVKIFRTAFLKELEDDVNHFLYYHEDATIFSITWQLTHSAAPGFFCFIVYEE